MSTGKESCLFSHWWKPRQSSHLAGLEIGAESLKLLKIFSVNSHCVVSHFATMPLATNVIVKGEIKDYSAVSAALKALIKEAGAEINQVALSIPRSSVIIKNTTVDKRLTSTEIESRAWIEANRHFPDLVGEIYLDYTIVGPSATEPDQLELMLVACRREQIKPYLDVLKQAGLTAKIVDVDCYALERALARLVGKEPGVETTALLNLDFNLSTFIVMQKNNLIYAHDHTYDGRRLTNQVTDYIKNNPQAALDEPAYMDILKESLSSHLRHTMHFFYSSRPNIGIQKMLLSGDVAVLPNLVGFLQKETGVQTVIAEPFTDMEFAPGINQKELKDAAPTFMLCCGLALSKPNV